MRLKKREYVFTYDNELVNKLINYKEMYKYYTGYHADIRNNKVYFHVTPKGRPIIEEWLKLNNIRFKANDIIV